MYLFSLTAEERKALYKTITIEDFKKLVQTEKGAPMSVLKSTGKAYDRLKKPDLDKYVEENYTKGNNPVVVLFGKTLTVKFANQFKSYPELEKILDGKEYNELTEEEKATVKSLEEEYKKTDLKLPFEILVKWIVNPSEEEVKEITQSINEKEFNEMTEEVKKLKEEIAQLKDDAAAAKKENNQIQKENNALTKDNKKLLKIIEGLNGKIEENENKKITTDSIKGKISDLLGYEFKDMEVHDLLAALSNLESESIKTKNYENVDKVLAAKYAINQILKEEK